jgi:hypothetical protein
MATKRREVAIYTQMVGVRPPGSFVSHSPLESKRIPPSRHCFNEIIQRACWDRSVHAKASDITVSSSRL